MPPYGMLRDKNDIKLLILYVLLQVRRPIPFRALNDIVQSGENVNYFDFSGAFNDLLITGHIDKLSVDGQEMISITPFGRETLDTLEKRLPLTVREDAMKNAIPVLAELKKDAEITADITPVSDGVTLRLAIHEGSGELFSLSLALASELQARSIEKEFREKPEFYYKRILALLAGEQMD